METATYDSPSGNSEVWEVGKQPAGYVTPEEWQAAHPAPEPTAEDVAKQRRAEIHAELDRIDRASARSLRAILTAQVEGKEPVNADLQMLATYEAEAVALREELQGLK